MPLAALDLILQQETGRL